MAGPRLLSPRSVFHGTIMSQTTQKVCMSAYTFNQLLSERLRAAPARETVN